MHNKGNLTAAPPLFAGVAKHLRSNLTAVEPVFAGVEKQLRSNLTVEQPVFAGESMQLRSNLKAAEPVFTGVSKQHRLNITEVEPVFTGVEKQLRSNLTVETGVSKQLRSSNAVEPPLFAGVSKELQSNNTAEEPLFAEVSKEVRSKMMEVEPLFGGVSKEFRSKIMEVEPLFGGISKQLRSNILRRKRRRFSPVIISQVKVRNRGGVACGEGDMHVELSDCSCVVSSSVTETTGLSRNGVLNEGTSNVAGGTITTSIDKSGQLKGGTSCVAGGTTTTSVVELSDCSCVVSNSVTENLSRNGVLTKGTSNVARGTTTTSVVDSGVSSLRKLNGGTSNVAGGTIASSVVESGSESVKQSVNKEIEECEVESAVYGVENENENEGGLSTEGTVSFPGNIVAEIDLECSENFSNDLESNSYSSVYSSVYLESSEFESLSDEYSTWFDSGSQFSEKSDPDGVASRTFQLLSQFRDQFYRSSLFECSTHKLIAKDYSADEVTLLGLENEEDEESYRMLKSRERRQSYLRDYAAEYCATGNGQLIIEQRLEMVHWIFEHSTNMELQSETLFLGINLLDRFFSKGYFKSKRNLQIAGIACLTLATRIEENQPYNSIRQKTFYVGNTAYSRCEVVAMEWLVQETLNFQCFLPTLYNFLWFYLKAVRADEAVGKTVGYLATLAMLSHEQMYYWPSTVAASLVILACKAAESDAHCHLLIESHGREKDDTLPECIKRLEWLVKYC